MSTGSSPSSSQGGEAPQYWYCLRHHRVEDRDGCPNKDRLGPFDTAAEAGRALEKAQERTDAWDHDPRWNDDELED